MKRLNLYICESIENKFFYIPEIEPDNKISDSQLKDWIKHGVYPDFFGGSHDYFTLYFKDKNSVKYIMPWLKNYWGCSSILQATNQVEGLYDAYTGNIDDLYAVVNDIDMSEKLSSAEHKKMKSEGVKIIYYPGIQTDYTAVLLCKTKKAFDNVIIPWLKKYCNGDINDVISAFPEIKKYVK